MSTLKVNDIEEATSGGGKIWPNRVWATWDSATTIQDSGSVSSLTDVGTGITTTNFSVNMQNAWYAVTGAAGTTGAARDMGFYSNQFTTSSCRGAVRYRDTNFYDNDYNSLVVTGVPS